MDGREAEAQSGFCRVAAHWHISASCAVTGCSSYAWHETAVCTSGLCSCFSKDTQDSEGNGTNPRRSHICLQGSVAPNKADTGSASLLPLPAAMGSAACSASMFQRSSREQDSQAGLFFSHRKHWIGNKRSVFVPVPSESDKTGSYKTYLCFGCDTRGEHGIFYTSEILNAGKARSYKQHAMGVKKWGINPRYSCLPSVNVQNPVRTYFENKQQIIRLISLKRGLLKDSAVHLTEKKWDHLRDLLSHPAAYCTLTPTICRQRKSQKEITKTCTTWAQTISSDHSRQDGPGWSVDKCSFVVTVLQGWWPLAGMGKQLHGRASDLSWVHSSKP